MNELTLEQHLKNLEAVVVKAVGTYDELSQIRASYLHIKGLVLNPPKCEGKNCKETEVIKP